MIRLKTTKHWQDVFHTVINETDFILEVLDARNPEGSHNLTIEQFVQKNRPEIQIFLVLNKIDTIPKEILDKWIQYYRNQGYRVYYVSARYHRGMTYLLRDLRRIITRPHSNVLIVGYPNTGKSTLIEALTEGKKKVGISSSAGFTRVIQKIRLNDKIVLLDTPGVIPIDETNETELALKACMIADKLEDPLAVVEALYKILDNSAFQKKYHVDLTEDESLDSIIEKIGLKMGKLMTGGKVNQNEVYKMIIRDWQNNRIPYFHSPPDFEENIENHGNQRNFDKKISADLPEQKKRPTSSHPKLKLPKSKRSKSKPPPIPPSLNLTKSQKRQKKKD